MKSATAISKVFGDGRKVVTVIVEYDKAISNKSLSASTYAVEGKTVRRVYANDRPATAGKGINGRFVVIELQAATDMNAQPIRSKSETDEQRKERDRMQGGPGLRAGWSTGGEDVYPGNATVTRLAAIRTADGKKMEPDGNSFVTTEERCLVADDFKQYEFKSPFTGQILPYNLYLPADYDPSEKYPLVLFIHDAGVASGPVTQTLMQGRGAVAWAEPEAQARHKCIVVAPEYPFITVDDNWNYSHHLDATVALIRDLQTRYSIDDARIYTTGQSMGCMSSIVLMLKEPQLFAGALLVAGKWNPEVMAPLADRNIWIISCEGDRSSNELQGQAVALWRENGAEVAEATWNMEASPEELSASADSLAAQGTHLLFTHLTGGSHRATWFVAYDIRGVHDWLFSQKKTSCH
ncbi:MAG: alpha/beta hydrolase-fold protein [Prevotella sp.]